LKENGSFAYVFQSGKRPVGRTDSENLVGKNLAENCLLPNTKERGGVGGATSGGFYTNPKTQGTATAPCWALVTLELGTCKARNDRQKRERISEGRRKSFPYQL